MAGAGVAAAQLYEDRASGRRDDRPGLAVCLKAFRSGDILVVWKLDRLGRDLRHLVNLVLDGAIDRIIETGPGSADLELQSRFKQWLAAPRT